MRKPLVLLLIVVAVVACKTAVVTPEGTEAGWSTAEGVLRAQVAGPMTDVVDATKATLTDLELVGVDSTVDRLKGKITARLAVGTRVRINLESTGFDTTAVKIKVGTFGDRSISLQILRNIERRLQQ